MLQTLFKYFEKITDEWISIHSSVFSFDNNIDLYIKANSELIFHNFFVNNFEILNFKIIDFTKFFLKNRLFEKIEYIQSTYLMLIYINYLSENKNLIKKYKYFDLNDIKSIFPEVGVMELMCYDNILQNKYNDSILDYFINTNFFKSIFYNIPTLVDMYLFTHSIFYFSHLGRCFSKNIDPKNFFENYLISLLGYSINSENYDLIGELLLCFFILRLDIEKHRDLLDISLKYLKHFIDYIYSAKISKEISYDLYHPILVINMLSKFFNNEVKICCD